ncbi:MAG: TatD family hydrolase [Bacteroidetes bacterium]|nr:TatD family hydrolase [Bacteroidota bacterium]
MIDFHSHNKESISGKKIFNVLSYDDFPKNKNLLFSVGMHPWYLKPKLWHNDMNFFESLVAQNNVVAIGECGLDWMTFAKQDVQKTVFIKHLQWAEKYDKPIIIHCVKAYNEIIAICKKANIKQTRIIHGFNNNIKIAEQLINAGFYLSFGEALLETSSNAAEAIKITPLDKIFLETDDSDVNIESVYEKAAELLNITQQELIQHTESNFIRIFNK